MSYLGVICFRKIICFWDRKCIILKNMSVLLLFFNKCRVLCVMYGLM